MAPVYSRKMIQVAENYLGSAGEFIREVGELNGAIRFRECVLDGVVSFILVVLSHFS